MGQFCGHNFPDIITSKDRFLWLHFHSDENIEYEGFKAVYEFIPRPTSGNYIASLSLVDQNIISLIVFSSSAVYDDSECGETLGGYEGFVNTSLISPEKIAYVVKHKLSLDCLWVIEVQKEWKVRQHNTYQRTIMV